MPGRTPVTACIVACLPALSCVPVRGAQVASPDGNVVATFRVEAIGEQAGCLVYGVTYRGRPVLERSQLGLELRGTRSLTHGFDVVEVTATRHDATWRPLYGQWDEIRDHYNQIIVALKQRDEPRRRLELTFRAYDEGVAFCYTVPEQPGLKRFVIRAEKTQFRFPGNRMNAYRPTGHHMAYATYAAQDMYQRVPISKIQRGCERPLTVEVFDGPIVSITEGSGVSAAAPLTTPWRVILIGDRPGDLLERSYLILNLNEPCAIEDTSWIKPGKVFCDFVMSTGSARRAIDFAVEQGIDYIHFDAGWYGFENDPDVDARKHASPAPGWSEKPLTAEQLAKRDPFDFPAILEYAKRRGVGVILYVNRRHLERQLDEILPVYEQWGIAGMKFGFVQVGSQKWTDWLHQAVRKAARHHLMVNVHDEYRPTGYSRTYPNLMTMEGILADECFPPSHHRVTLMFTRMLAGAGDYTHPYYNYRSDDSRAHKLAALVAFYSPLQYVYWYDRPTDLAGPTDSVALGKGVFAGGPETEFIRHVPVVWDDLRVIYGKIDDYVTIARCRGRDWYVGTMNARFPQKLDIPLAFLDKGQAYVAHIYSDAGPNRPRTAVRVDRRPVDSGTVLTATLRPNGGQAIRIVPAGADRDR